MPETQIKYDELVQNALRGVVRDLLRQVAENGLPGAHHFYIAFKTRAPNVEIPEHLKQRYPDDMTIVVQHRFWGLEVYDDYFAIGLSFNHKPERLVIPFDAIIGFVDPSVQFALQFQDNDDVSADGDNPAPDIQENTAYDADSETKADDTDSEPDSGDGGNVVTLDAFRKKT